MGYVYRFPHKVRQSLFHLSYSSDYFLSLSLVLYYNIKNIFFFSIITTGIL